MTVLERFLAKVSMEPTSGCWLWTGAVTRGGYGHMAAGRAAVVDAHRVSYELHVGPIPAGLCVCHRCDNRACVNPAHLFLETKAGNSRDMVMKGRQSYGERNPHTRVPDETVRAIRTAIERGDETQRALARRFGVGFRYVSSIARGHRRRVTA